LDGVPALAGTQGKRRVGNLRRCPGKSDISEPPGQARANVAQGFRADADFLQQLLRVYAVQFDEAQHHQPDGGQGALRFSA
jgi:hypothetical protein